MKELFSKEDLNATEFNKDKYNKIYFHSCCGKVNIKYNNKNITGYILDESRGKWKILLSSNKIIYKNTLTYNNEKSTYIYGLGKKEKYIIDYYWPIQMLLKKNGKGMRITLNRVAFIKKQATITKY